MLSAAHKPPLVPKGPPACLFLFSSPEIESLGDRFKLVSDWRCWWDERAVGRFQDNYDSLYRFLCFLASFQMDPIKLRRPDVNKKLSFAHFITPTLWAIFNRRESPPTPIFWKRDRVCLQLQTCEIRLRSLRGYQTTPKRQACVVFPMPFVSPPIAAHGYLQTVRLLHHSCSGVVGDSTYGRKEGLWHVLLRLHQGLWRREPPSSTRQTVEGSASTHKTHLLYPKLSGWSDIPNWFLF